MSRGAPAAFVAALQQPAVTLFPLIDIAFSSGPLYLAGVDHDVSYGGRTYIGAIGVMSVSTVTETASSFAGVAITISGVTSYDLSMALQEPMQGRAVRIRLAAVTASGLSVDDAVWVGQVDYPEIIDQDQSSIVLHCEHRMATWARARPVRYTDAMLQAAYPGDLGLQYVAEMASRKLIWPLKQFFKV